MATTKLQHKILLIIGSMLLAIMLVEFSLRLGGLIFKTSQEITNRTDLKTRAAYRILCLGESMVALGGQDAFPRQLERILNDKMPEIHFKVINKGIPSTTTTQIIANLPHYLKQYDPHIVVAMMGINDGASFVPIQEDMANPLKRFGNHLRLYKFYKLLKAHIAAQLDALTVRNVKRRINKTKDIIENNPSANNYRKMASLYRVLLEWDAEKEMLQKALAINPRDYEANAYLGMNHRRRGDYQEAIEALKDAIRFAPNDTDIKMQSYAMLVECLTLMEQYDQARDIQMKAINDIPNYVRGWGVLGDLFVQEGKCELAKPLYMKQLEINPTDTLSYIKLTFCLKKEDKYETAEKLLTQAITFNPKSGPLNAELGSLLMETGKYKKAEKILKKCLTLPESSYEGADINIHALLYDTYRAQGNDKKAQEIKEILETQNNEYNLETYKNYQTLQKELAQRNIYLFAVQYPLRSVQRLKTMINGYGQVFIVDNEKSFKEAMAHEPYDTYFIDRFAGDFGHCTPKGNRLIAENIADSILDHIPITQKKPDSGPVK